MAQTIHEYRRVVNDCKKVFLDKTTDYGASWRILRLPSITDQLFIKAQRIRSIQQLKTQLVEDSIEDDLVGLVNYCIIALIQLKRGASSATHPFESDLPDQPDQLYADVVEEVYSLMEKKNHDYSEAWCQMRVSSMIDIILMKLLRIKQIENHQGKTLISEGVKSNYQDVMNYAVFSLIKLKNPQKENRDEEFLR